MSLLIIGYCHLADGFLYASNSLIKKNYDITLFPYLSYKLDNKSDIEIIDDFYKILKEKNIDICLWWNNSIDFKLFIKLYNKNLINILYNWDPFLIDYKKYNCSIWEYNLENKKKIYPYMNFIFSCFEKEIKFFSDMSIYYNGAGFDRNISYYLPNDDYSCDISIVCTNLYNNLEEFPYDSTNISRYEIVDKLYNNRKEVSFKIYGPENFKNKYPECYKGFISYENCNLVFSNSKINLSIHPLVNELNSNNSNEEYYSERVPQILGCKGLLVTNSSFNKYLKKDEDYIFIDNNINWYEKLIDIIKNTDKYDIVRENGYKKALDYYQWDKWGEIIHNKISNL